MSAKSVNSAEMLLQAGAEMIEVGEKLLHIGQTLLQIAQVGGYELERFVPQSQQEPAQSDSGPLPDIGLRTHTTRAPKRRSADAPPPEERIINDDGDVITIESANQVAIRLVQFSRNHFAETLKVDRATANTLIALLREEGAVEYVDGAYRSTTLPSVRDFCVEREGTWSTDDVATSCDLDMETALYELSQLRSRGVIRQLDGSDLWEYIPTNPRLDPKERPRRMPPERERPAYEEARATGVPVRIRKDTRRTRSVAGANGIKGVRQKNLRYEKTQQTKEERAQQRKARAQANGHGGRKKAA